MESGGGVKLAKGGSSISHLFSVDDLILFRKTSDKQAWVMSDILKDFCRYPGQRVSMAKSKLFLSEHQAEHW